MGTPEANVRLARSWLAAFNAKDVPSLIALYAEDATHTSPKIRALHPETGGELCGTEAIAEWWRGAIARTPGLRYEEITVTASVDRVMLEYVRHADDEAPLPVAEAFDIRHGRIAASRVYHG